MAIRGWGGYPWWWDKVKNKVPQEIVEMLARAPRSILCGGYFVHLVTGCEYGDVDIFSNTDPFPPGTNVTRRGIVSTAEMEIAGRVETVQWIRVKKDLLPVEYVQIFFDMAICMPGVGVFRGELTPYGNFSGNRDLQRMVINGVRTLPNWRRIEKYIRRGFGLSSFAFGQFCMKVLDEMGLVTEADCPLEIYDPLFMKFQGMFEGNVGEGEYDENLRARLAVNEVAEGEVPRDNVEQDVPVGAGGPERPTAAYEVQAGGVELPRDVQQAVNRNRGGAPGTRDNLGQEVPAYQGPGYREEGTEGVE